MDNTLANEVADHWEKEEIPIDDLLFMRVSKNHIKGNEIQLIAFKKNINPSTPQSKPGLSTEWVRYSSPQQCRQNVALFKHAKTGLPKDPSNYEVVQFIVRDIIAIPNQTVEHTPIYQPTLAPPVLIQAHTDIFGEDEIDNKENEVQARLELSKIWRQAMPFGK